MKRIFLPIIVAILFIGCSQKEQDIDKKRVYKGFNHKPSIKIKEKRVR